MTTTGKSITFAWNPEEFDALVRSCQLDEGVQLSMTLLQDHDAYILEAGCGLGRVVKYLHDLGFRNVEGIELNHDAVSWMNTRFPDLKISYGDLLKMPYDDNLFDVVLSYGVVEHFKAGLQEPLQAMFRVLKPGGIAVVTVPSNNVLRQWAQRYDHFKCILDPRRNSWIRLLCNKPTIEINPELSGLYYVHLKGGRFFEYRLHKREFERCCRDAGYEILQSVPISHIDGLYHSFGSPLVHFENWSFFLTRRARMLNAIFKTIPFFHNHMHACVLKKPEGQNSVSISKH